MPKPKPFVVGREAEDQLFRSFLDAGSSITILNVYGSGGIGKTTVKRKFEAIAQQEGVIAVSVDAEECEVKFDALLYEIASQVDGHAAVPSGGFASFFSVHNDYLITSDIIKQSGGVDKLYDALGGLKEATGILKFLADSGKIFSQNLQQNVRNKFSLQAYLKKVDGTLCDTFCKDLSQIAPRSQMMLFIDTYEKIESADGVDRKLCKILFPSLPERMKIVILGRNPLTRVNWDWKDYEETSCFHELTELSEDDSRCYLFHYGLRDEDIFQNIYKVAGGYPLLLSVVAHLKEELGEWSHLDLSHNKSSLDDVSYYLIERLIKEEKVEEIKDILVKGCVAPWLTPSIIGLLLETDLEHAKTIYDKLRRHSFTEHNAQGKGLCFQERIRSILRNSLEFTNPVLFAELNQKLDLFLKERAGLES